MEILKLARGTIVVLAGTVASSALVFAVYVAAGRSLGSAGYGVLSISVVLTAFIVTLSTLGLRDALPRELAYLRARGISADEVASTALALTLFSSTVSAVVVIMYSGVLASLFGIGEYSWLLRLMVASVPLFALLDVLVAVARAYGRVVEKSLVRDVGVNLAWLVGALASAVLGLGLLGFALSYVASAALGLGLVSLLLYRAGLLPRRVRAGWAAAAALLSFSVPLLVSGTMNMLMTYTDTLMLGALRGAAEVGLYNAAAPLARFVPVVLGAAGYLVLPLFSELYARNDVPSLREFYVVVSRWVFVATYPLAAVLVAAPRLALGLVFGREYLSAAPALVLLSLGFLAHVVAGPNGITLVVLRESRVIMAVTVASSALNVLLNALLIVRLGLVGAAAATVASYVFANVAFSWWLYRRIGLNPLQREYLAPLAAGAACLPLLAVAGGRGLIVLAPSLALTTLLVAAVTAATPTSREEALLRRAAEGTVLGKALNIILGLGSLVERWKRGSGQSAVRDM